MLKRFRELLYKLISVKGLFAIVGTVLSILLTDSLYFFVSWGVLIGAREILKIVTIIKGLKE